jgi:hypothetical protein
MRGSRQIRRDLQPHPLPAHFGADRLKYCSVMRGPRVSALVGSLAVDEFTIGPIRTPQELDLACRSLLRIFPSLEPGWPGPASSATG